MGSKLFRSLVLFLLLKDSDYGVISKDDGDHFEQFLSFCIWEALFPDLTQNISYSIVLPFLVFEGEVILRQLIYPPLFHGIHIRRCEKIGEGIIVHMNLEAMTQQIALEMYDRPLHGQEFKFGAMVVDLHSMQCPTSTSNGMIPPIQLILG